MERRRHDAVEPSAAEAAKKPTTATTSPFPVRSTAAGERDEAGGLAFETESAEGSKAPGTIPGAREDDARVRDEPAETETLARSASATGAGAVSRAIPSEEGRRSIERRRHDAVEPSAAEAAKKLTTATTSRPLARKTAAGGRDEAGGLAFETASAEGSKAPGRLPDAREDDFRVGDEPAETETLARSATATGAGASAIPCDR